MSDETANEVLKFWSDYEATARTGKRAAETARLLGTEVAPTPASLTSAWEMINPHVADDYTFVDPYGYVQGKDHLALLIQTGAGVFMDYERTEHQVKVYGDTAVYVSKVSLKGTRNGQDVTGKYRETHTLIKREHGWVVLATQMTKVDEVRHQHSAEWRLLGEEGSR